MDRITLEVDDAMTRQKMDEVAMRTIDLLGLADVPRWSVIKTLRPQSVAEHSFAVAVLTMELITRLSPYNFEHPVSLGAVIWAICHDAPETYTGDIDGLLKREHPAVKAALEVAEGEAFPWYGRMRDGMLPPLVALVKVADTIESIVYLRQWGTGSRANNVRAELRQILYIQLVPVLARAIGDKGTFVEEAVDQVLDRSTLESSSYQFRRSLKFDQTDQTNPINQPTEDEDGGPNGHGQSDRSGQSGRSGGGQQSGDAQASGQASDVSGEGQGENRGNH